MAQLSDDCFAFGGALLRVDEAVALIASRIRPVPDIEDIPVAEALGRILAHDAAAIASVPHCDNSAVDGYAVRFDDLLAQDHTVMPVSQRVQAGQIAQPIASGSAVRIFTGAQMPPGADTVFMQEDVATDAGTVRLPPGLKRGANRRRTGEDFAAGAVVVRAGTRLDARHLAGLTATGVARVRVRRAIRVALFSTGDELGHAPEQAGHRTLDANRPLLHAVMASPAIELSDLGILPDAPDAIRHALRDAAARHDVILTTGGVSAGEADFVRGALSEAGALTFWRLAIKPGRPVAMGTVDGAAFVGLPGNPVAALITFLFLARPLIAALAGEEVAEPLRVPAVTDTAISKKAGRREFLRASVMRDGPHLRVRRFPREGAALLSSLVGTDGLIELGEDVTDIEAGALVNFIPYRMLFN